MWEEIDFIRNKIYWANKGNYSLEIREDNIKDIIRVIKKNKIKIFLEGETLLYLYFFKRLKKKDHDDDLGVFWSEKNFNTLKNTIIPELNKLGFTIIRENDNMISIERNYRYVDICFFRIKNGKIGYSSKLFELKYYRKLNQCNRLKLQVLIPKYTVYFLLKRYFKKKTIQLIKIIVKPLFLKLKKIINLNSKIKVLTLKEFLNLKVEGENSINWIIRKNHLDIVTNNKKNLSVIEIIKYFKKIDLEKFESENIVTSKIDSILELQINTNKIFWKSGNNYFFNCIKYGFRKNVVEYKSVNNYFKSDAKHIIYSSEYFSQLPKMNKDEIKNLLENPIEITKNHVTSGRHRVYAMIGHILKGGEYIEFKYLKKY